MNINRVRRIVKAQLGLTTSSFFPNQNLTYLDSSGLIMFNNTNQQWQNRITSSLFGNPYMKSNGIPTVGKPSVSPEAELAGLAGMQKLLQLQQDKLTETLNIVAGMKNPEKAASQIATGKAEIVDGLFLKKSSLNQGLLNNIGSYIGQGADFMDSFIPKDYSGKYGSLKQGGDQAFDLASSAVMLINPLVGGIMKAGGFVSDILTNYAGMGTDNMTKTDAILGSKLLSLTPWGMANGFFGKKTQDFSADNYTIAQVGGSYGGSVHDINNAVDKANKKYGWFSSGARKKANRQINEARRLQNLMADIADNAMDRAYMGANMSDLNHIGYGFNINGGYDLRYMRAAKLGGTLERVKKINFHKIGGTIDLDWVPEIVDSIEEGGNIEWEPTIILKEGGKTDWESFKDAPLYKEYELRLKEDSKTTLKNVIPEGALHARKHNMENAEELTKKGIPVVDDDNQLQAEIERNELILTLEVTKKLEELYNDGSDEAAIEAGKLLVYEILENTDDRTGLIAKCENGGVINGAK